MPCERPYPPGMMPEPHGEAEFDAFASHYDAGMSDPFKRIIGGDADTFLEHKADWLLRTLAPSGRLLDFGCGNGRFLRALRRRGGLLDLAGYDASAGMIDAARRQWDSGPPPVLHHLAPSGQVPFADREFDMVTAVCVLHHIRPSSRLRVVREMARVLKSGGVLVIFEHNPLNPVTRWLVRRAPIDAAAILLSAEESAKLLREARVVHRRTDYILFFPPRWRRLWRLEPLLARLPVGGQYMTVGTIVS